MLTPPGAQHRQSHAQVGHCECRHTKPPRHTWHDRDVQVTPQHTPTHCADFIPHSASHTLHSTHTTTTTQCKLQNVLMYMCTLVNAWLVRKTTASASCSGQWQHGKSMSDISKCTSSYTTNRPRMDFSSTVIIENNHISCLVATQG